MLPVPTVGLNGIDVYYERSGRGPRLLFVNGSGSTLTEAAPILDRLRADFDVLAHDQRGLGRTTIADGPYTMADYASDAAALAAHVGWQTYAVVGISFGGMVALELAVTVPERIERLAVLVTSAGGAAGASYPLQALADLPAAERATVGMRLMDTRYTPEWLAAHPAERAMVEAFATRAAAPKSADVLRGERLQLEARSHHDTTDRLHRITCPTFVGAGRYDGIAPPANGEAIAACVPGAELHLYEGGHGYLFQDRQGFRDLVEFLRRA